MTLLVENLVAAHSARAERAKDNLMAAAMAPGLFKPEFIEEEREKLRRAQANVAYWSGPVGGGA